MIVYSTPVVDGRTLMTSAIVSGGLNVKLSSVVPPVNLKGNEPCSGSATFTVAIKAGGSSEFMNVHTTSSPAPIVTSTEPASRSGVAPLVQRMSCRTHRSSAASVTVMSVPACRLSNV